MHTVTRLLPETSRRDRPAEDWISVNRRLSLDCRLQGNALFQASDCWKGVGDFAAN
jgi:hypothetical protein